MLKCAEAHNLSPAQLEKLGQTFNTAKTLVGLEKQAHRGDSFTIVNVPEMLTKYSTYNPDKVVSRRSQKVQDKVDRLFEDDQDGWSACISIKAASTGLPDFNAMLNDRYNATVIDDSDEEEYAAVSSEVNRNACQWHKEASAYSSISEDLDIAEDLAEQLRFEIPMEISDRCGDIARMLTPDEGRWGEAAEDIYAAYGQEKAAAVIATVQRFFNQVQHYYEPYGELTKQAYATVLVRDRHNVFPVVDDIIELNEVFQKVATTMTAPTRTTTSSDIYTDTDTDTSSDTDIDTGISSGASLIDLLEMDANDTNDQQIKKTPKDKHKPKDKSSLTPPDDRKDLTTTDAPTTDAVQTAADVASDATDGTVKMLRGIANVDYNDMYNKNLADFSKELNLIAPSKDKRRETIDEAIAQAEMDSTLQRLMISDPIISDADPDEVQRIFKTIADISPTLARSPEKMSAVLKEALQYGSVPINILADISKFEGQELKNRKTKYELDKLKYGINL